MMRDKGKERQPDFVATATAGEQKLANPFSQRQNQIGFGIAADIPDRSRATRAVSEESNRTALLSGPTQHGPGAATGAKSLKVLWTSFAT